MGKQTQMEKKRALIRAVLVLYAAFHPQISKCFNMTVLSLFTMWETRRSCTLRQGSEHEVTPHTHTHIHILFLAACSTSGPPMSAKCPALSPGNRHKEACAGGSSTAWPERHRQCWSDQKCQEHPPGLETSPLWPPLCLSAHRAGAGLSSEMHKGREASDPGSSISPLPHAFPLAHTQPHTIL